MLKNMFSAVLAFVKNKTNWLSFIAGLSLVFAYAPFEQWWLPLIIIPCWLFLLDKNNTKPVQACYAFAVGWFTSGISWVHVSIADFGGMPLLVSLLLMFFLCLYLALYPALSCWLSIKTARYINSEQKLNLWLLAPFWLLTEYFREHFLTGFPWLSLGYRQINSPLSSFASIVGETGITIVLLLLSIALVRLFQAKERILSALIIIFCGVSIVFASTQSWVTATGKTIKTALVQGNIAQELKWLPEKEWPTLELYLSLTEATQNIDIFVWPESAIPALEPSVQDYLKVVNEHANSTNSAVITGIINYNFEQRSFFNSVIVLGNKTDQQAFGNYLYGHENRYSKHHLLPIGEFVPFEDWLRPIAPLFNLPMSSFKRGDYIQPNLQAKDIQILPLLCFEIAFPEQLAANYTDDTQLLLTVSNDAWFADSHGPHQHMEIARMRALEFGRPLVRSTNTGITAAVDHFGQFINQLPQFEQGVLISDIALVEGITPYAKWGRMPIYSFAFGFLLLMLYLARRQSRCQPNLSKQD